MSPNNGERLSGTAHQEICVKDICICIYRLNYCREFKTTTIPSLKEFNSFITSKSYESSKTAMAGSMPKLLGITNDFL
jgi:hypothetical protein